MQGGRDHFGWDEKAYILANIYDAIRDNTRATGNWKHKPPNIPPHPRPKSKPKSVRGSSPRPKTVKDLFNQLTQRK